MAFAFGAQSLARLDGVHPDLVRVAKRAVAASKIDFMVVEGVRSDEDCKINYGKGRTAAQCVAAGIGRQYAQPNAGKVTWLKNPLNSRHRKHADGFGRAIDLLPAPYDWKDPTGFDAVAKAMLAAAKIEKVRIRWGADWDADGVPRERGETDSPHFELA